MSEGLNRVFLMGNIGADPELCYTQGGQPVLHLRLATTESYVDKEGTRKERTDWHDVTIWGKRGEALGKILAKGSQIFVEGSLRTSSYNDKKTGDKRYKTEVIATNVIIAGKGRGREADEPAPERRAGRDERQGSGRQSARSGEAAPPADWD